MKTKHLFLLPALAFLACAGLQAQVRIGDTTAPATGAVLDLNSTAKGGLLLSNISIADWSKIPTGQANLFPGITEGVNDDMNIAFTGAMVYHTGTPDIPAGIYIWNGVRWIPPGGCDCPAGTVADDECNCYPIGYFGNAGTWMTQNLRTTEKYYAGIDKTLASNSTGSTTNPYYTYPRLGAATGVYIDTAFNAHKDYGLLYNWVAASGRTGGTSLSTDESNTDHARYQGICPTGWHLPSDKEWIQLEEVIAAGAAGVYSSEGDVSAGTDFTGDGERGTHGTKMKSTIDVNGEDAHGTSNSRENNGFDVLFVGYVDGSGNPASYGTSTYIWSSSSFNAYTSTERHLYAQYNYPGVSRGHEWRTYMFSVRCKKND
jgi:uncharacterized protein (TIGR02145 family)